MAFLQLKSVLSKNHILPKVAEYVSPLGIFLSMLMNQEKVGIWSLVTWKYEWEFFKYLILF